MSSSRAAIITQAKSELGVFANGLSEIDDATGAFYYPLNNTLARMGKTDTDVPDFTINNVRIAVIGVQYYVVQKLLKKFYAFAEEGGRKRFINVEKVYKMLGNDFTIALSGLDKPGKKIEVAESSIAWGPGDLGSEEQTHKAFVSEFGEDNTDYGDENLE